MHKFGTIKLNEIFCWTNIECVVVNELKARTLISESINESVGVCILCLAVFFVREAFTSHRSIHTECVIKASHAKVAKGCLRSTQRHIFSSAFIEVVYGDIGGTNTDLTDRTRPRVAQRGLREPKELSCHDGLCLFIGKCRFTHACYCC